MYDIKILNEEVLISNYKFLSIYYQVKARESVMIAINETSEFWLYLHAKGEEYFLHYDFWPYVPFAHHFKDTEYWVDINVRKKVLSGVIHKTDTSADTISNTSDYFGNIHFL